MLTLGFLSRKRTGLSITYLEELQQLLGIWLLTQRDASKGELQLLTPCRVGAERLAVDVASTLSIPTVLLDRDGNEDQLKIHHPKQSLRRLAAYISYEEYLNETCNVLATYDYGVPLVPSFRRHAQYVTLGKAD